MTHTVRATRTVLLILALLPLAGATATAQSRPFGLAETITGTWDVSIQVGGVLIHQKWVMAADGRILITNTLTPIFSTGTWRRNAEYFQIVDDLGGKTLNYRCTLSGDTFSMFPVDMAGRWIDNERYIGERRR